MLSVSRLFWLIWGRITEWLTIKQDDNSIKFCMTEIRNSIKFCMTWSELTHLEINFNNKTCPPAAAPKRRSCKDGGRADRAVPVAKAKAESSYQPKRGNNNCWRAILNAFVMRGHSGVLWHDVRHEGTDGSCMSPMNVVALLFHGPHGRRQNE